MDVADGDVFLFVDWEGHRSADPNTSRTLTSVHELVAVHLLYSTLPPAYAQHVSMSASGAKRTGAAARAHASAKMISDPKRLALALRVAARIDPASGAALGKSEHAALRAIAGGAPGDDDPAWLAAAVALQRLTDGLLEQTALSVARMAVLDPARGPYADRARADLRGSRGTFVPLPAVVAALRRAASDGDGRDNDLPEPTVHPYVREAPVVAARMIAVAPGALAHHKKFDMHVSFAM